MATVTEVKGLKIALLIMRLSFAAFFAVWVIEKFVAPETTQRIWKAFYFVEAIPLEASYVIGAVQAVILIAFVLGIAKLLSTGLLVVMHGLSTLSTWERLIDPYTAVNHLFWAAVPALGLIIALLILREHDTLLTVGGNKVSS
ncbi:MAG: DoxX protein [Alphaproteobacteria bacterium]